MDHMYLLLVRRYLQLMHVAVLPFGCPIRSDFRLLVYSVTSPKFWRSSQQTRSGVHDDTTVPFLEVL
jgi:hypothetical protein